MLLCLQEDGITKLLLAPGELKDKIPGISGTRALNDNLSDMKAQVAANNKGIGLVHALIEEYTLDVVQAYMHHIQVCDWCPGFAMHWFLTWCYWFRYPLGS